MSSPDTFIRLSTDNFSERDRFEAARELFGRALCKTNFEPLPDTPFGMEMALRALPDLGLACVRTAPVNIVHPQSLADSDDLILVIPMSGGGVLRQRGREAELSRGQAVLSSSEMSASCYLPTKTEGINFRFRRSRLSPLVADLDATLVTPISTNMEAMRLLVNYVGILQEEHALATPELRNLVVTHLHDLAALAIGATHDATAAAAGRGIRAARLRAIRADISETLSDRNLSIDMIAARHRVTPRYVRKLFESEPLTFSEFVLDQRLRKAHRKLTDPRFAHQSISSIAFDVGFGDLSYFNRTFRRRYGMTPSDVRDAALRSKE